MNHYIKGKGGEEQDSDLLSWGRGERLGLAVEEGERLGLRLVLLPLTAIRNVHNSFDCSTTGKPTRSFATERVSLDSV